MSDEEALPSVDPNLCAEHRDGKPGEPHEWRRGRRKTRVVTCTPDQPPAPRQDDEQAAGVRLTEDEREALCVCPWVGSIMLGDTHTVACSRHRDAVERILTAHRDTAEAERAALVERVEAALDYGKRDGSDGLYPEPGAWRRGARHVAVRVRAALAATTDGGA